MSQGEIDNLENEGGPVPAEDEVQGAGEGQVESPAQQQGWAGPSQEEWQQTQRAIQQMASYFVEDEEEQPTVDQEDIPEPVRRYIEQTYGQIMPHLQAQSEAQGRQTMTSMFKELEAKPDIGRFDHEVAEYYAQRAYEQHGNPQKAVEDGARAAASLRNKYAQEGQEELKKSLSKRGRGDADEVEGSGSAERIAPGAKTYDEVIEAWASQSEV